MRLIAHPLFNAVVEGEWRCVSTSNLSNYLFIQGCCFAETGICLAGVASFNLTYFNLIQFKLI
jgi:hypothetical protein